MSQKTEMEDALREEVGSVIYTRGKSYFRGGRVSKLHVTRDARGCVHIDATVRGTARYRTKVEYDPDGQLFNALDCSCPYGYGCKHTVATVLAYLDEHDPETDALSAEQTAVHTEEVRAALAKLGIAADALPESLIGQLLTFQKPKQDVTHVSTKPNTKDASRDTLQDFPASSYTVLLNRNRGYSPTLHPKGRHYERANIDALLSRYRCTEQERTLLEYVKKHDATVQPFSTPRADPNILFPLLASTSFQVMCSEGYYATSPRSVQVVVEPPPIPIRIVHEAIPHPYNPSDVRHEIRVVLPNERQPGRGVGRSVWSKHDNGMVHETDTQVRLYVLTRQWRDIIHRACPLYDVFDSKRGNPYQYYGTALTGAEIERLPRICHTKESHITLEVEEMVRGLVIHTTPPKRVFNVFFDATAHVVRVTPCAEYGVWQSNLTETFSRAYVGYAMYKRRHAYAHDGKFLLTEHEGTLQYLRFHDKEEVAFYKAIEASYEDLGFTKTLKCLYQGQKKVTTYMDQYWKRLCAFADSNQCEIVFTHDTLPKERVSIFADFTSDVDAEKDWLHFDVNLYCAGEKVTLEKLYAYMESGANYWRKDDGTLVEVENREELERLVRLLKTFRNSADGGFEGKLHHAPELTYVMTSSPHYSATQTKSLRDFMKRVESGKPVKKVRLPARVKKILRPYQEAGVEWLYFLRSYHFAGILADDMGLGKTVQALAVLAQTRTEGVPSLVVCPKSLLYNWKNEATTFFPDMRVLVYDGTPVERTQLRADLTTHDMVVVSYSTLKRDKDVLCGVGVRYNYAVLDEAQYIKNHMTKMAQCVKEIPADYRLALTGTPLENHVFELWSIYDYLMPGFLGKHEHFKDHYHRPIMERGDLEALAHLRKKVESFMLRRTKEEVLQELPPKVEQTRECVLTDAQNVLYQQILKDVRGTVFDAVATKGFKSSHIHILAGLTKLRQVCNHPALVTKDVDYTAYESAKLDACLELIEEVRQSERKVLVFSQFTGMLDILARACSTNGIEYTYLSGKTRNRQEVIDRFNGDPKVTAFLISMKAGGTGLNLTSADNVIVFDPWWNPSVERQAIDRAHRIGQTKSVNVYRLLTKGTIEEKMQALKRKKQSLFDSVVEESGELFKKLTWEDIRELFAE